MNLSSLRWQTRRVTHSSLSLTLALTALLSLSVSLNALAQPSEGEAPTTEVTTRAVEPVKEASKPVKETPKKTAKELEPSARELTAKAAKEDFETVKEARLNELRYKHLWIAYSLVWLIIFVFIRGTWRRSQAVEENLQSLQSRLAKLEEK